MNFSTILGAQPVSDSVADTKAVTAAQAALDDTRFTNAELMKYMGWSEAADYTAARTLHGLPPADAWRQPGGNMLGSTAGEPTRLKRSIDTWIREQQALADEKLRLIRKRV